jgi:hypothetical protein
VVDVSICFDHSSSEALWQGFNLIVSRVTRAVLPGLVGTALVTGRAAALVFWTFTTGRATGVIGGPLVAGGALRVFCRALVAWFSDTCLVRVAVFAGRVGKITALAHGTRWATVLLRPIEAGRLLAAGALWPRGSVGRVFGRRGATLLVGRHDESVFY